MQNQNIVLKDYTDADKPKLLQLMTLNIPNYFDAAELSDFSKYLDSEREIYYVVQLQGKIVGCGGINFEERKTIGIISWDIIHPDYQGQKLGKRLLKHRIDVLKSIKSVKKIVVRTSQHTNLFYEKQGFVLKEHIPNYWAKGIDLCYMEYGSK